MSLRRRSRLPFVLAALAAGLAGVVAWQARLAPDIRAAAALPAAMAAPPADGPPRLWSPPPLDSYAELLRRPPFAPDRRAAAIATAPAAPPPPPTLPPLRCAAIVQAPDGAFALVEIEGRERLVRARPGDLVAGWTILAVLARSIRIAGPDGEVTLSLVPPGGGEGPTGEDDLDDDESRDGGLDDEDFGDEDFGDEGFGGEEFDDEDFEEESAGSG